MRIPQELKSDSSERQTDEIIEQQALSVELDEDEKLLLAQLSSDDWCYGERDDPTRLLSSINHTLFQHAKACSRAVNIHNLLGYFADPELAQHWFNKSYFYFSDVQIQCITNQQHAFGFLWQYELGAEALDADYQLLLEQITDSISDKAIVLAKKIHQKRLHIRVSIQQKLSDKKYDLEDILVKAARSKSCHQSLINFIKTIQTLEQQESIFIDYSDGNPIDFDYQKSQKIQPLEMLACIHLAHKNSIHMPFLKESLGRQNLRPDVFSNPYFYYIIKTEEDFIEHKELFIFHATNARYGHKFKPGTYYFIEEYYQNNTEQLHIDMQKIVDTLSTKYQSKKEFDLNELNWAIHYASLDQDFVRPWLEKAVKQLSRDHHFLPFQVGEKVELKNPDYYCNSLDQLVDRFLYDLPPSSSRKEEDVYINISQGKQPDYEVSYKLKNGQYPKESLEKLVSYWNHQKQSPDAPHWLYDYEYVTRPELDPDYKKHRIPAVLVPMRTLFTLHPETLADSDLVAYYMEYLMLVDASHPALKSYCLTDEMSEKILSKEIAENETAKYISESIKIYLLENTKPFCENIYYLIELSELLINDENLTSAFHDNHNQNYLIRIITDVLCNQLNDLNSEHSRFEIQIKSADQTIDGYGYLLNMIKHGNAERLTPLFNKLVTRQQTQPIVDFKGLPLLLDIAADYACKDYEHMRTFTRYYSAIDANSAVWIFSCISKVIKFWTQRGEKLEKYDLITLISIFLTSGKIKDTNLLWLLEPLHNEIRANPSFIIGLLKQMAQEDINKQCSQQVFSQSLIEITPVEFIDEQQPAAFIQHQFTQACFALQSIFSDFRTTKKLGVDLVIRAKDDKQSFLLNKPETSDQAESAHPQSLLLQQDDQFYIDICQNLQAEIIQQVTLLQEKIKLFESYHQEENEQTENRQDYLLSLMIPAEFEENDLSVILTSQFFLKASGIAKCVEFNSQTQAAIEQLESSLNIRLHLCPQQPKRYNFSQGEVNSNKKQIITPLVIHLIKPADAEQEKEKEKLKAQEIALAKKQEEELSAKLAAELQDELTEILQHSQSSSELVTVNLCDNNNIAQLLFTYPGHSLSQDSKPQQLKNLTKLIEQITTCLPFHLNKALANDRVHQVDITILQKDQEPLLEEAFFEQIQDLLKTDKGLQHALVNYIDAVTAYQHEHWQVWIDDQNGMAIYAAGALAMQNKNFIKPLVSLLNSCDLSHEVSHTEWIDNIISHWGYIAETYYLIAARAILIEGQYGLEGIEREISQYFSDKPKEINKYLASSIELISDYFADTGSSVDVTAIASIIKQPVLYQSYITDLIVELTLCDIQVYCGHTRLTCLDYRSEQAPSESTYLEILDGLADKIITQFENIFSQTKKSSSYAFVRTYMAETSWLLPETLQRAAKYPSCAPVIKTQIKQLKNYLQANGKTIYSNIPKAMKNQQQDIVGHYQSSFILQLIEPLIGLDNDYFDLYLEAIAEENNKHFYHNSIPAIDILKQQGLNKRSYALLKYFLMNSPFPLRYQAIDLDKISDSDKLKALFAQDQLALEDILIKLSEKSQPLISQSLLPNTQLLKRAAQKPTFEQLTEYARSVIVGEVVEEDSEEYEEEKE